jgi:glycosyltransferase involved in cell wall biosynthesis
VYGTGGGPEKTILRGAEGADVERVAVTVCYLRDARDRAFGVADQAQRFRVDYVEIRERHSFDLRAWAAVSTLVRERRIELVHSHDYKTDAMALWLRSRTGAVPLATAHGWTGDSWRERAIYYPLDKRLLARFPAVVAVSRQIRDELVDHGCDGARITVLLNGIDPAAFHRDPSRVALARARLGLHGHVIIGSIGRLEQQKRFDLLIDAVARLRHAGRDIVLVIAGEGSRRSELEAQVARLRLAHAVRLLGHRADVIDLHHAFDVFVQSSDYEGTPNAVLEAMALETPIVATAAGGTAELATDGVHARIVPCGSAERMASAIDQVLRDPAGTRERTTAARRRIETELSFEARTRKLEQLYVELSHRHRPTRRSDACASW